jgi:anti-repressor protein
MATDIITFDFVQALVNSGNCFPVDFDDAWQWLGYARKDSALRKLKKHFSAGQDFSFHQDVEAQTQGSRTVTAKIDKYDLTVDCFKELGMLAGTEQGKLVRKYYLQCERIVKEVVPAQSDRIRELELELQLRRAEQKLIDTRQLIVTTCPEVVQQKILGYQLVEKTEYIDRCLLHEQFVRDGNTATKTELCQRYSFLTRNGKPNYPALNQFLAASKLPSNAIALTAQIREGEELRREYLPMLDEAYHRYEQRSLWMGEK